MDIATLAGALVAAQMGKVQLTVAGDLLRNDATTQQNTVKQLLDSATQSTNSLANVAAGLGTSLDVTA